MPFSLPRRTTTRSVAASIGLADDRILRTVHRYQLVAAEQICRRLYRPSVIAYVRGRLSHLANAGVLERTYLLRPSRTGSGPIVYSLGSRGRSYLAAAGEAVPGRLRSERTAQYGYFHLKHALGVTDVLLAADLVAACEPRFRVHRLLPAQKLWRLAVKVDVDGRAPVAVCPDAWLDLRLQRDAWYQHCLALEFDRGTEHQPAWRRKVAALLAWANGPYRTIFGTESLTIAVLTTAGEPRCRALVAWSEAELRERGAEAAAGLFAIAACEPASMPPAQLYLGHHWVVPFQPERRSLFAHRGEAA